MTNELKSRLKYLLIEAHKEACHRENMSTVVLKNAYVSNGGDAVRAVSAAMGTLGGFHAPVAEAYKNIKTVCNYPYCSYRHLSSSKLNGRVAGFGSSFFKGDTDPLLMKLHMFLAEHTKTYMDVHQIIIELIEKEKGIILHANLAFYTAWTAIELGYEANETELLVLEARVPEWCKILKEL